MQQQPTMFQGKSYRLRRESKNRYEFRSPYTVQFGTAAEIEKLLSDQMGEARISAIELAAARSALKQVAAEDGLMPEPKIIPAVAAAPAAAPAPTRTPAPRRKSHHVSVVPMDDKKPKRRPNGLNYLRSLMAQAAE